MFPFLAFTPLPAMASMMPLAMMGPFAPLMMMGMAAGRPAADDGVDADADGAAGSPLGASMVSMLPMMRAMAPWALAAPGLARVVEDAGQVAAQVRESLARDDGPVHVVVGDPDGPLGLSIGLTVMTRNQRARLAAQGAPAAGADQLDAGAGPVLDIEPTASRVA
jgi:hypothetical protein